MRLNKTSTLLLWVVIVGISAWIVNGFLIPQQGPVLEQWETHNSKFKIRVQRRKDLFGLMTYWYVFQSARNDAIAWREVTRHLFGEPVPLPKKQIRFIGEDVGYLFFQLKYAVTVDAGDSWTVFDFGNSPSFKPEELDYSKIADVVIRADGTGEIIMSRYDSRSGQSTLFFTRDFGQDWTLKR